MAWLLLKAEAKTAIAVPRRFEAGNLYESQMEIPGTMVRGAFAIAFLNKGKIADENFERIFESHKIRFGPLRPLPKGIENFPDFIPVMPIPKSARSCKYDDGLLERGHGVLDFLFEVAEEIDPNQIRSELTCEKCNAPIEPLEKPWLVANWSKSFGIDYKPDFRLSTHVGIGAIGTEEMGVAMEGRLFSLQYFPQGTKFSGWISVNDSEPESLIEELGFKKEEKVWQLPFYLRVGRRSSTYGALKVEAQLSDKPPWQQTHGSFEERWENFQNGFWKRFVGVEKLKLPASDKNTFSGGYVFSVTFVTDTILIDSFLRPYVVLTEEEVAKRLGITESKIKILSSFARPKIVRGWNNAHRLPKEQDLAIASGSVFLFIVQRNAILEDEIKKKLKDWEEKGIGWRRSEGFGQVLICDPWHIRQSSEELVPLSWEAREKEFVEPSKYDEQVVKFIRAIEAKTKKKLELTKTQLQNLRTLARIIDATYQHLFGEEKNPCKRLKHYLEHQRDRGIKGWSQEILWKGKEVKLADGLIDVLELESCKWETSLRRLDQFVQLMLLLIAGRNLDSDFEVSDLIGGDER